MINLQKYLTDPIFSSMVRWISLYSNKTINRILGQYFPISWNTMDCCKKEKKRIAKYPKKRTSLKWQNRTTLQVLTGERCHTQHHHLADCQFDAVPFYHLHQPHHSISKLFLTHLNLIIWKMVSKSDQDKWDKLEQKWSNIVTHTISTATLQDNPGGPEMIKHINPC